MRETGDILTVVPAMAMTEAAEAGLAQAHFTDGTHVTLHGKVFIVAILRRDVFKFQPAFALFKAEFAVDAQRAAEAVKAGAKIGRGTRNADRDHFCAAFPRT